MKNTHKYSLCIVDRGLRQIILENEQSPEKVRSVAKKIKQKFDRKIIILRDQKELLGGSSALDNVVYQAWFESHQPIEVSSFEKKD